jgi:hypothetical protein
MAVKPNILTERTLILFKPQTARGTPATPDKLNDAMLVSGLSLALNPTKLERKVFRPSFSPIPSGVGRKLMKATFSHEIKSSGDVGITRPKVGTLMRCCGWKETLVTTGAASQIGEIVNNGLVVGPAVAWGKTAAPTSKFGSYRVTCVLGGASATAKLAVSRWGSGELDTTVLPNTRNEAASNDSALTTLTLNASNPISLVFTVGGTLTAGNTLYAVVGGVVFPYTVQAGDATTAAVATAIAALIDADTRLVATVVGSAITVTFATAAVTVTSATTPVPLGSSGATITPTWTGNLVAGQEWIVQLYETGYMYQPMSDNVTMLVGTLWAYQDGQLSKITDCTGTVTFTGTAGNYSEAKFEFTGNYADPVEEPIPLDATFEPTVPSQLELAQMSISGDNDFCAQAFTITLANTINPKECMNKADGYDGSIISGRAPTAQLDPEATYEIYTGMWKNFSKSVQFPIAVRVGTDVGNTVRFYADRCNYTGLTYGDRNGLATLQANFQLNGVSWSGDDEIRVQFC